MAGRIRDEDVKAVRDASAIADVIGEHIQLRSAGGGNLKGLCPFHDEKSPSFNVTPARGLWHCFGCGEGGDVITFLTKLEHLSFNEAVEQLAKRARIELRYAEGGYTKRTETSERARLLEAHSVAAEYYREQLTTPAAKHGREFLNSRGFDAAALERFGVGYAPGGWDALVRHLRGRGFTDKELLVGGLASEGRRGPIDRFRDRLAWPIADIGGEVIGFGARRLSEDKDSPKYLNTPETPLYKKSSVLYGLDLARKELGKQQRAVVVEGYTDVMACHLAGETTAIATCGTAFGEEHIKILRRLLADRNQYLGCEVVFTFDGDSAGQKAALRAFMEDQRWVTQTFVAVQPDGMDPCDLRIARGDAAVRDLVSSRIPLFEFAIRARLSEHNLDTPEGRVRALRAAAPIVAAIHDPALRPEYARRLAGWLGFDDVPLVLAEVRRATPNARRNIPGQTRGASSAPASSSVTAASHTASQGPPAASAATAGAASPSAGNALPTGPASRRQREALKLALQYPKLAGATFDGLGPEEFTAPAYAAVHAAISAAGGASGAADPVQWLSTVSAAAADDSVRSLINRLAVEPLMLRENAKGGQSVDARYATELVTRIWIDAVELRRAETLSRLRRLDPVAQPEDYQKLSVELNELNMFRAQLFSSLD
ncbi:DNA primase [Actinocrinis puniceicyclus]|uniref:DNA primase n=1 Tax=Actinocrinis puniceicyclus TaxID=977794 RepID=A0A8J8BCM1_9ACTN|nr:DNA primase [Actinocrinis puniceicyclus]MBS2964328.1 DNA primase [Actinocrinis puniceicyclus]